MIRRILTVVAVVGRLLVGAVLTLSGLTWLDRPDAAMLLHDAVSAMVDEGRAVPGYGAFLRTVVLPNAGLFAGLVSWGELLSGVALLLGVGSRLAAGVAIFQMLNYGLMGGFASVAVHMIFVAILFATTYRNSGRTFGIDRWLHRKWPRARIW